MKKNGSHLAYLLILSALFLAISCKKSSPKVIIVVKDAINGSMVNGATVGLHRCPVGGSLCGWIAYRNNTTGNDGSCSFEQEDYNVSESITVGKIGYWAFFEPKSTFITIYPDGWLKVRIIKGSSYPPNSTLRLVLNYVPGNKINTYYVPAAADSIVKLRGYGGASNRIDWFVTAGSGQINNGSFSQNIPRQDSVNYTLNY
ncbi:MAG: hypothetical protein M3Y85_07970 [Bacteroidota bacterium]|nr:hypothetical protein [Bacteroidota bacterium]